MSANNYLCYTYLIGWSKLDLWYYGVRYAQVKRKQDYDLWIDYHTHSAPIKHMRAFIGEPDIIHYDKVFDSIDKAKVYELKVLKEHDCKNSIHWLNKNDIPAPPIMIGKKHPLYGKSPSKETRKKQGIKNKGNSYRKGKIQTKESRNKMSINMKGRIPHNRKKVKINGIIFNSYTEAAKYHDVCRETISYWIKKEKAFLI